MPIGDIYVYDLVSCGAHPSINGISTAVNPSPYAGMVVYKVGSPQAETYVVTPVTPPADGLNAGVGLSFTPQLAASNLINCADSNADKIYRVINCADQKVERFVLLPSVQTIGNTTLRFTGECTCWLVVELVSTYTEILTIDTAFVSCADCIGSTVAQLCSYEERTIGYATLIRLPQPAPPDRGFKDCCYSQIALADNSDTDPYKNDFSSVFFQKQTPADTVTFEIIGLSTGVTPLVDGTHGVLYDFDVAHTNPDLSYFKVEWRKILALLGEDTYTIRMNATIAGIGPTAIDSNSFQLRAFSLSRANNTVRIDSKMDGTMEKIDVDFKNSGYENSLRVTGFFGDAQENIEQDNVIYSQKNGQRLFVSQISARNDPDYIFQANNIPECISRELRKFIIFGNEIFISDYNDNNHSYEYELYSVVLDDVAPNTYPIKGRGVNIEMTFKGRSKDNIKTNC